MRWLTHYFLVLILLVPVLWVWPQRGVTMSLYANPDWQEPPLVTRVERQIDLETVTADPAAFPQQQFTVRWDGWLRIDHAGLYTFSTRTDDGSTLELDRMLVVDNGGEHHAQRRSGIVQLAPGLYRLRLRFLQTGGTYQFYASWTPPGGTETPLPTQPLFADWAPAPVVFLTRHVLTIWALCWFALALVIAARVARAERPIDLRRVALSVAVVVVATTTTVLAVEAMIRVTHYLRDDRRSLKSQLQGSRQPSETSLYGLSLGDIVEPSPHEGIIYELRPNVRGRFMGQPLVINSRGMRDHEYSVRKDSDTFRIVGLGDSSLFGWGVALDDSTLKVLERSLNERSSAQTFEVLNFAVPGYNTAMEAETFVQKCLAYEPDLVVLSFNTNDYDVPDFMRLPREWATLRKLYVFELAYSAYEGLIGIARPQPSQFDFANRTISVRDAARLDEDPALPDEYRHMVGAKGVVRALERLAGAARERGIPLLVFDAKAYPGLHPTYARDELRDGQRELLTRESRRLGFHFLNTYAHYIAYVKQHPEAPYPRVFAVSDIDSHPNELSHAISAQAILDYLIERQLVPIVASSSAPGSE